MKKLFSKALIALAVVAVAGGIFSSNAEAYREDYMGGCLQDEQGVCSIEGGNQCYCGVW